MDALWTSDALYRAVKYYLRLLQSQLGGGRLTPETVCAVLAKKTGHAVEASWKVMNTLSWLLSMQGARLCTGFPPQCDAGEDVVMGLEHVLHRQLHIRRRLRLSSWRLEDTKAAVGCYRRMLEDVLAGQPFSVKDRIAELASAIPRSYTSVKAKLGQITWVLDGWGLVSVPGIPPVPIPGEKTASLLESLLAGFVAFKTAGGRGAWKTEEFEAALQTYQALAELEASCAAHDPGDSICTLARRLGRRFSECRLCLASIASLRRRLGLEAVRCLPEGEGLPEADRRQLEQVFLRRLPR